LIYLLIVSLFITSVLLILTLPILACCVTFYYLIEFDLHVSMSIVLVGFFTISIFILVLCTSKSLHHNSSSIWNCITFYLLIIWFQFIDILV
jgi:hypothetical protein